MRGTRPLLLLIDGAVPGLGKSTLSRGLAAWLREEGLDVELFEEHEVLGRPEFASLVEEWRSAGMASFETLLDGTKAYLETGRRFRADAFVLDSVLPFTPSLLAWGRSDGEITTFFAQLGDLMSAYDVLHVQLEGDAPAALERAAEREGGGWLASFIEKVAGYDDGGRAVTDRGSVATYLGAASARSRKLLAEAPWPVWFLDRSAALTLSWWK